MNGFAASTCLLPGPWQASQDGPRQRRRARLILETAGRAETGRVTDQARGVGLVLGGQFLKGIRGMLGLLPSHPLFEMASRAGLRAHIGLIGRRGHRRTGRLSRRLRPHTLHQDSTGSKSQYQAYAHQHTSPHLHARSPIIGEPVQEPDCARYKPGSSRCARRGPKSVAVPPFNRHWPLTSHARARRACREWTPEFNLENTWRQESKIIVKQEFSRKLPQAIRPGV